MNIVVPAIIPKNFKHLEEEVAKVKDLVNLIQIDICDGQFVKNKTWPFVGDQGEFEKLSNEEMGMPFWEDLSYEFHLMIEKPELTLEKWISLGADSVIFHIESTEHVEDIISVLKSREIKVGISLKPSTDNEKVIPFIEKVDFLQVMGNDNLGQHYVELDPKSLEKIKYFREKFPNLEIAIDIGVNEKTALDLKNAGVTKFISGGALFESPNIKEEIEYFEKV